MFRSTLMCWINCTKLFFPLLSASSGYTCSVTVSSSVINTKTSTILFV